jgi:uncharacterized low-complexity protein
MKILSMAALVAALAAAPAAFAQQASAPTATKVDCEKAKMKWDEKGSKDSKCACVAATPAPAKAGETPKK